MCGVCVVTSRRLASELGEIRREEFQQRFDTVRLMQVMLIISSLSTTYETVTWVNQATGPAMWMLIKLGCARPHWRVDRTSVLIRLWCGCGPLC